MAIHVRCRRRPLARVAGLSLGIVVAVGVGGCAAGDPARLDAPDGSPDGERTSESTTTMAPVDPTPSTPPAFAADIVDAPADRVRSTWRPECPVDLSELRLLSVSYWGFDGAAHVGEVVVHERVAQDVVGVFETLYDARFPIRRMVLVDEYGGDDNRSMAADNTSGYNCRTVAGTDSWSQHAYGLAIDINPCENPYVQAGGLVSPPKCARFTDRDLDEPGVIHPGDVVVSAFAEIGWEWGGDWTYPDYQHFAAPR